MRHEARWEELVLQNDLGIAREGLKVGGYDSLHVDYLRLPAELAYQGGELKFINDLVAA
jgi:hypothetical protein